MTIRQISSTKFKPSYTDDAGLFEQIRRFLDHAHISEFPSNRLCETPEMQVYLKSYVHPRTKHRILIISRVTVIQSMQRQGMFTQTLSHILTELKRAYVGFDEVIAENILTAEFTDFFRVRGWRIIQDDSPGSVPSACLSRPFNMLPKPKTA